MSKPPLTPKDERAEAERGEKLWNEFHRWEHAHRLFPFVLGAILIAGAAALLIIEHKKRG